MVKSKTTLKEVMKELKLIKSLVIQDLQIDAEDMDYNKKHLPAIRKSLGKSKKIFLEVEDWKNNIWDGCTSKKIISRQSEFRYDCKILKRICKFEYCPLNVRKKNLH